MICKATERTERFSKGRSSKDGDSDDDDDDDDDSHSS